jgi:Skp family chaperone for outer membrane proteins
MLILKMLLSNFMIEMKTLFGQLATKIDKIETKVDNLEAKFEMKVDN